MEVVAQRVFSPLYIWLDIIFLALMTALLLWKKKYMTVVVGFLSGILYMLVDYGVFHMLTHSRSISAGHSLFWVLLWMSMSYGFTNFTWIWLWISKDKHLFEWSFLIISWWICCPLITKTFGAGAEPIVISRTAGAYHGYMAILLFIGYLGLIIWNFAHRKKEEKISIPWLLGIGVLVQFGWEACLFMAGIRSATLVGFAAKAAPLLINSLLETNLGMAYIFVIFIALSARYTERMRKREHPLTFTERVVENRLERVRSDAPSEFLGDA